MYVLISFLTSFMAKIFFFNFVFFFIFNTLLYWLLLKSVPIPQLLMKFRLFLSNWFYPKMAFSRQWHMFCNIYRASQNSRPTENQWVSKNCKRRSSNCSNKNVKKFIIDQSRRLLSGVNKMRFREILRNFCLKICLVIIFSFWHCQFWCMFHIEVIAMTLIYE